MFLNLFETRSEIHDCDTRSASSYHWFFFFLPSKYYAIHNSLLTKFQKLVYLPFFTFMKKGLEFLFKAGLNLNIVF